MAAGNLTSKSTPHTNNWDAGVTQTLLHLACRHGHLDIATILVKNGYGVNDGHESLRTPFLSVCKARNDNIELAEFLFEHGAIVDRRLLPGYQYDEDYEDEDEDDERTFDHTSGGKWTHKNFEDVDSQWSFGVRIISVCCRYS